MRRIALVWMGFLLLSCGEKVVEKPENLIPKDKMVHILHDLAVLSAAESSFKSTLDSYGIETMAFLYQKYQIDSTQLVQSDVYYASLPLEYQSLYEAVAKRLNRKREMLKVASTKRNDSVQRTP